MKDYSISSGSRKQSLPGFPLISIITVVLNGEKHIRDTIESVLNQTYRNIEYIIIDGGSRDSTLDIIKEFDSRIDYWVSEPDSGISDAFNKGIAVATGDVIGIINSDDWYEKDAVQKIADNYSRGDVFYGDVQYWLEGEKTYLFKADHTLLKLEMSVNHPAVFVKRELYQEWGVFNKNFRQAMDYELLLRLYLNKVSFCYLNQLLANMRLEGISDTNWIKGCREVMKAKNMLIGNKMLNAVWFLKQVFSIAFSRVLDKMGLSFVVAFYRKYSPVKKVRY